MKYRLLTKEQFEALHQEFALFLATQKIDAKEWDALKQNKPEVVDEELAIFSDLVWEDVLSKTHYIEHFSRDSVNFFHCDETEIHRIYVKVHKEIDLLEQAGFEWLLHNPSDAQVELFTGSKPYDGERNLEIFDLIEKGGSLSKGELYEYFNRLISK